ncbi:uncharacterized protein LOC123319451 [Coccinella septempunctata]|uniref:uncharacterized protein LOC123319451 n=1 Tax=Coccinella septempunctata TaxID=41139 RepID=UPI001D0771CF|nr:uncharacterized protein LOC123319451 [Coccinella septempunctata]
MGGVWFLKFSLLCVVYSGVKSDDEHYDTYNYFYKELGCVKNEKTAANAFNCPDFPSKNGSCRFMNQYFPSGVKVDQELLKGSCIPEAQCNDDGSFIFPGTDCGLLYKEGCYSRNSLDSCCPTNELVCGDDVAKCEIEGKTYKEGEKFHLKESCDVCLCDKGFKKEAPFCRPVRCNLEILRSHELADHDAPVYLKGENCCPSTWIKDEGEDEIVTFISDVENLACKFGKRDVGYGQGFYRNISRFGVESKLKCECNKPPFVICHEI